MRFLNLSLVSEQSKYKTVEHKLQIRKQAIFHFIFGICHRPFKSGPQAGCSLDTPDLGHCGFCFMFAVIFLINSTYQNWFPLNISCI